MNCASLVGFRARERRAQERARPGSTSSPASGSVERLDGGSLNRAGSLEDCNSARLLT